MGQPDGDGAEDGCGAVDDGEFVVAGGQAAPLLDGVEVSFDDVAALVVLRRRRPVVVRRVSRVACGGRSGRRVRESPRRSHGGAARAADRSAGVGLVARGRGRDGCVADPAGAGPLSGGPANARRPGRRWLGRARPAPPAAVRAPSTRWWILLVNPPRERPMPWSGGSIAQIRVIRPSPLCGG